MLLINHRMIEGSPLHYQCPEQTISVHAQNNLFRPYLEVQHNSDYYPYTTIRSAFDYQCDTMSEDLTTPRSLHSPQMSDSEGSITSLPESPKPKSHSLKCCWKNCGIDFESLDQLASHVGKVHGSSGPGGLFYCGWEGCTRNDRAFNARYKMLVHVRTHTNEKPHQCYQCDKSFSRAENLKIHIRSHSGEKPYVCPVAGCSKAYSNSSDRFKHTRTHQVDKPYQCKVLGCSKRYTDPSSLRKHVKTYKHYVPDPIQQHQAPLIHQEYPALGNNTGDYSGYKHFKENDYQWRDLMGCKLFAPYHMEIEIETPLDLSISRKSS